MHCVSALNLRKDSCGARKVAAGTQAHQGLPQGHPEPRSLLTQKLLAPWGPGCWESLYSPAPVDLYPEAQCGHQNVSAEQDSAPCAKPLLGSCSRPVPECPPRAKSFPSPSSSQQVSLYFIVRGAP